MNELLAWTGLLSDFIVFIDQDRVNINDLVEAVNPGAIVRCDGDPHSAVLIHVSPNDKFLGCIGGMISDD
jgi:hypothetical protein